MYSKVRVLDGAVKTPDFPGFFCCPKRQNSVIGFGNSVISVIVFHPMDIRWHPGNRVWTCNVGLKWNKARTKLVYAQWYFTANEAQSRSMAEAKRREWREIREAWEDLAPALAMTYPSVDRPFWPDEKLSMASVEKGAVVVSDMAAMVTVGYALDEYRDELRGRVGLRGRRGLKPTTLATRMYQLSSLAKLLPVGETLLAVGRQVIQDAVDSIWRMDITERTMLNYTRELSAFLAWCDDNERFGWNMPKGARSLLTQRAKVPPVYIPTLDEVRAVYAAARPRFRRFILLALNTGMTQKDIAAIDWKGGEFLTWRRAKTSHQNDFDVVTWLFPETRVMLKRWGVTSKSGRPMYRETPNGREDRIAETIRRIRKRAGVSPKFSFKSLRKFSAQWMRDHAGETMARMFLGQKVPGVLSRYVKDDYAPLTEWLQKYRAYLNRAGIPEETASGRSRRAASAGD